MGRKRILFIGKGNTVNGELFQDLNQLYDINSCVGVDKTIIESIQLTKPSAVLVSLIGEENKYHQIFDMMRREYPDIPVITIGTEYECRDYVDYYLKDQFYQILRPINDKEVIEKCKVIIGDVDEVEIDTEEFIYIGDRCKVEPPHVLIVDDNAMVLRNVKAILQDKYSVAVAASGAQAFVSIGKKCPDIILLDYEMPMMNGEAVLEMLHQNEELKDIPVIFLTSAATKDVVTKLLALKPAGYILKPADGDALISLIEKTLGR